MNRKEYYTIGEKTYLVGKLDSLDGNATHDIGVVFETEKRDDYYAPTKVLDYFWGITVMGDAEIEEAVKYIVEVSCNV